MRKLLFLTIAAIAGAGGAQASLLGIETEDYPALVDDTAAVYWDHVDRHLNVTGYGQSRIVGETGVLYEDVYFQIDLDVGAEGGIGPLGGTALVDDLSTFEVGGTVTAFEVAVTEAEIDAMEFLIDFGGSGEFLATITGSFGDAPFIGAGEDYFAVADGVRIAEVAPIPLPAGGAMLLAAFGGLALRAGKSRTAA